ncbi:MAG: hypothetical protein R2811_09840 [Flavobacteriales bacterium]
MNDQRERLQKLDKDKLIDVVKNYRQYGYDEQIRQSAIDILAERGITKEHLQITGGFENRTYDYAKDLFDSFLRNSLIAFVMFLILFTSRVAIRIVPVESAGVAVTLLIVTVLALILYFIFLIMSFMNQNQFYKAIGQDYGTEGALLYLFLGMPLYMFMYFYFRNQMKEKMKEIR